MPIYYYLFLSIALLSIVLFVRFLILKKKNTPVTLFAQALKKENSGDLKEAIVDYKCALNEVKKVRFHSSLESKILQKLKVLNTVVEYSNNSHFPR